MLFNPFMLALAFSAPAQQAPIIPVGNYHAHMKSEASARLLEVPRLSAV
jgi:hypothetical protein